MKRSSFVLGLWIVFMATAVLISAQDSAPECMVLNLYENNDQAYLYTYSIWRDQGDGFALIDSIAIKAGFRLSPAHDRILSTQLAPYESDHIIYAVSADGFTLLQTFESEQSNTGDGLLPRNNAWSFDGRYIAFRNIFDGRDDRLIVYDTERLEFHFPLNLGIALYEQWSPERDWLAIFAYDRDFISNQISNESIYITTPDGSFTYRLPITEAELGRFQWVSGDELGVTHCIDEDCRVVIHNIVTNESVVHYVGRYMLERRLNVLDGYLLSSIGERNPYLLRDSGEIEPLFVASQVLSMPMLSADGHFLSFRAIVDDVYQMVIIDLENNTSTRVDMSEDLPDILTSNASGFGFPYGFYYPNEDWHPTDNDFLYEDDGIIYSYDAEDNIRRPIMEATPNERYVQAWWVCDSD